jgi:hypothetical protein
MISSPLTVLLSPVSTRTSEPDGPLATIIDSMAVGERGARPGCSLRWGPSGRSHHGTRAPGSAVDSSMTSIEGLPDGAIAMTTPCSCLRTAGAILLHQLGASRQGHCPSNSCERASSLLRLRDRSAVATASRRTWSALWRPWFRPPREPGGRRSTTADGCQASCSAIDPAVRASRLASIVTVAGIGNLKEAEASSLYGLSTFLGEPADMV